MPIKIVANASETSEEAWIDVWHVYTTLDGKERRSIVRQEIVDVDDTSLNEAIKRVNLCAYTLKRVLNAMHHDAIVVPAHSKREKRRKKATHAAMRITVT